jgi:hypothetical protein
MNSIWTLANMDLISGRVKEGSRGGSPERGRLWAKIGVRAFVACLCVLALSPASQATEFFCLTPGSRGATCLINAIKNANNNNELINTITLGKGSYVLVRAEVNDPLDGATGLPSITSKPGARQQFKLLTIQGVGSGIAPGDSTIISRAGVLEQFRIFHLADPESLLDAAATLILSGLKIRGGVARFG